MTNLPTIEEARKMLKDYAELFGIKQLPDDGLVDLLNENIKPYDGDFTKLTLTPTRKGND